MKRGCTIGFSRFFPFFLKYFLFEPLSFEGALAFNVIAYITYSYISFRFIYSNCLFLNVEQCERTGGSKVEC